MDKLYRKLLNTTKRALESSTTTKAPRKVRCKTETKEYFDNERQSRKVRSSKEKGKQMKSIVPIVPMKSLLPILPTTIVKVRVINKKKKKQRKQPSFSTISSWML